MSEDSTLTAVVAEFVADHGSAIGPAEVSAALDVDRQTAGKLLRRLADRGAVRKVGRGRFEAAGADSPPANGLAHGQPVDPGVSDGASGSPAPPGVTFVCEQYPSLEVLLPDGAGSVKLRDGKVTVAAADKIAALDRSPFVTRQAAP